MAKKKKKPKKNKFPKIKFPPLDKTPSQDPSFPDFLTAGTDLLNQMPKGKKAPSVNQVGGQVDILAFLSGK